MPHNIFLWLQIVELQTLLYICIVKTHEYMETPLDNHAILGRIRYLMELNHLTQAQFARRLRIDPSNISKYLSERLPLSDALLNRIIVDFNVSKEWLRDGQGVPYEKRMSHAMKVAAGTMTSATVQDEGIPVYDIDVAAGCAEMSRAFTSENVIGKINFPHLNPRWVAVRAKGDSMVPVINNGGYVAFTPESQTDYIVWGQIYVVVMENRRVVKYVRRHHDPKKIILKSANPAYDDMDVSLNEVHALYLVERIINISDCF